MVQMKCEKQLCGGWMRISTATLVNAKGLMESIQKGLVDSNLNELTEQWVQEKQQELTESK